MMREVHWMAMGFKLPEGKTAPASLVAAQEAVYSEFSGRFEAISMMPVECWWDQVSPDLADGLLAEIEGAVERLYIGTSNLAAAHNLWQPQASAGSQLFIRLGLAQTILASWERALDLVSMCLSVMGATHCHPMNGRVQGFRQSRKQILSWKQAVETGVVAFQGTDEEKQHVLLAISTLHGDEAKGPNPPGLDNLFFGHVDRNGANVRYDELRDGRDAFAHAKELSSGALKNLHPDQIIEANCSIMGKTICFLTRVQATFQLDNSWGDAARAVLIAHHKA
jgi:hypothetical protein